MNRQVIKAYIFYTLFLLSYFYGVLLIFGGLLSIIFDNTDFKPIIYGIILLAISVLCYFTAKSTKYKG